MLARILTALTVLGLTLFPAGGPSQPLSAPGASSSPTDLMFVENVGQFDPGARFWAYGASEGLWLAPDGVWLTAPAADGPGAVSFKVEFVGANPGARLEPFERLDMHVSYFVGGDPSQWHVDVPVWGGVRYVDLYPGIDLEVGRAGGQLALRLDAPPGADLSAVRLHAAGAERVTLDGARLQLSATLGQASLPLIATGAGLIPAQPTLAGDEVLSPFAAALALAPQASPADLYSTLIGAAGHDQGWGIAVDANGAAYVTGDSAFYGFPTTPGAFQSPSASNAFVVKLAPSGSSLTYAAWIGGSGSETGYAVALDAGGAAYVTGNTTSPDFPVTAGAPDGSYHGGEYGDAFVLKLNATGTALAYSTYLGGNQNDFGYAIAARDGAAYVSGYTGSSDFPATAGAFDASFNGGFYDAFVAKLNSAGTAFNYVTFLGGSDYSEYGKGIAVDSAGAAYVTGYTLSNNFPTTGGAYDSSYNGGSYGDGFVTKLNASGTGLVYSTYIGGANNDNAYAIAIDASGWAYLTGYTASSDFPTTAGALDTGQNGGDDAFVLKLNPTGTALGFSTFLGGGSGDKGCGIAVDSGGAVYLAGETMSTNFPVQPGAFDASPNGSLDGFIATLNPAGSALTYATYVGGSSNDYPKALAIDATGAAYLSGYTQSGDYPTTHHAFDTGYNEGKDVFVTKLRKLPVGVDGFAGFTAPVFGAGPGKIAALRLYYTNYGASVGTSVDLALTFDNRLTYVASANGAYEAIQNGSGQVTLYLKTLYPLSNYEVIIYLRVPSDAAYGTRYAVSAALTTTQPDIATGNNTSSTQVLAGRQVFVPLALRW